MKTLLLFTACSLSACSPSLVSSNPLANYVYNERVQHDAKMNEVAEASKARQAVNLKNGAMSAWDRIEVNAYKDYMDAKYGPTPVLPDNKVMDDIPESRK